MKANKKIIYTLLLCLFYVFFINNANRNVVKADEIQHILTLENPIDSSTMTGDILLKGWSISSNGVEKIDVYVDELYVGQANYGIDRVDVANKYPSIPLANKSGFVYKLRGYSDGKHVIQVASRDKNGNSISKSVTITVNNRKTPILGQAIITKQQMLKYFNNNNNIKSLDYISNFVDILNDEAKIEGIRSDIVFAQIMLETNFLKFGGDVKEEQNNFAGLGATGGGVSGASFPDIRTGIRAVIQHLKAYASTDPLKQTCVDPRFNYVTRGTAKYVEYLGINENPDGYGWATSPGYGYNILKGLDRMAQIDANPFKSTITSYNIGTERVVGNPINLSIISDYADSTLYEFWVKDYSTGQWSKLRDYSQQSSIQWTPSKEGTYRIVLQVKNKYSKYDEDDYKYEDIVVKLPRATMNKFTVPDGFKYEKNTYTMSADASSTTQALYRFWLGNSETGVWSLLQDYSTNNTYNFYSEKPGKYRISVDAKDKYSKNDYDSYLYTDLVVYSNNKATISNISFDSNVILDKSVTFKASGNSENSVLYRFWMGDLNSKTWTLLQDFSEKDTISWTPKTLSNYRLAVDVKDKYSRLEYDNYSYVEFGVKDYKAKISSLSVTGTGSLFAGEDITINSTASSLNQTLYRIWLHDYNTDKWTMLKDYNNISQYVWKPNTPGKYRIVVDAKDSNSRYEYDDYWFKDIEVNVPKASVTKLTIPDGYMLEKNSYTISAEASSTTQALFRFWLGNSVTGEWRLLQDYSTNNVCNFYIDKPSNYRVVVDVKDKYSKYDYNDYTYKDIIVYGNTKAKINSFDVQIKNNIIYATAQAVSGNVAFYRFWLGDLNTGQWKLLQDYSVDNKLAYKLASSGKYRVVVDVKDRFSRYDIDEYKFVEISSSKTIVIDPGHNYGGDDGAYAKFGNTTYSERDLNMQLALKLKAQLEQAGFNVILTRQESDRSTDSLQTSLQKRVDIANNAQADLFISLHHDSSPNTATSGISVHYSTYKPGIDTSGINPNGNDPNGWYTGVNIDTTPSNAAIVSRDLAIKLADGLSSALGYNNLKAHDHNLFVTVNTNMPAILIENGFITNQSEAQKCADTNQQNMKAQTISKIINDYFSLNG